MIVQIVNCESPFMGIIGVEAKEYGASIDGEWFGLENDASRVLVPVRDVKLVDLTLMHSGKCCIELKNGDQVQIGGDDRAHFAHIVMAIVNFIDAVNKGMN